MAFSLFDIVKGTDFTALTTATAADHNTLVDAANPVLDTSVEGKGFVIWSVDSALDTPIVPDPTLSSSHFKWKRYVWLRVPHSTATNLVPKLYVWNDNATSIATYLKWRQIEADLSSVEADITALENDVADLQADIATVSSQASAAVLLAGPASTNASKALGVAGDAKANAQTAIADAAAAQTDADAAQATADAANTAATSATTAANAASASVTALAATVKSFTSSATSLNSIAAAASLINEAHGLGAAPRQCRGVLVCTATDVGYAVGDEVDLASVQYFGSQPAFSVWSNSTNVGMSIQGSAGPTAIYLIGKLGTGSNYIDKSKWSVKVYAQL